MESSVATHSEEVASTANARALLRAPVWEQVRGRQRGSILARMLVVGDAFAALTAAVVGGSIAGLSPSALLTVALGTTLIWPAVAFTLGLYNTGSLRFWASGVGEVPQALTVAVLFAWPLLGLVALAGADSPEVATATIVLGTAVLSPIARASVRTKLHGEPRLRQRAVIVGSGLVAGQLVEKMRVHGQYGIVPVGLLDDTPHEVGTPDLPRLGTSPTSTT